MIHRIEIATRRELRDARGEHAAEQVRSYLDIPIRSIRTRDVYHVEADLTEDELGRVVHEFCDPVLHNGAAGRIDDGPFDSAVRVAYKPGVTDPIGKSAKVAIQDTLGRELGDGSAVYTSVMYLLDGVDSQQAEEIAIGLLANPVIQDVHVADHDEWRLAPPDLSIPKIEGTGQPAVETIDLSGNDDDLLRISRDGLLALSLREMKAIRDHFRQTALSSTRSQLGLSDAPTDVELECLAQTWSEHCKHKIFNSSITYYDEQGAAESIESLFKTYIRGVTEEIDRHLSASAGHSWLVSVFHDNAGVIEFDDQIHLVYKVETHNSPSALDPYGGAITGIVGVNRDPFGTGRGADLLVNVWGYCFASPFYQGERPEGLLHPKRIRDGVHWGVIDGGNQSGIPYGRGWELFDNRYLGKPLVFCGTVGALPVSIDSEPGEEKFARPGDAIVMVGGRIGADGIHGATFSSAALDESSPAQAVQIGDPITQRMMFDFLVEARANGLYSAITDNGAGGLSSSVGEMAQQPGGARLDLERAPQKYAGLAPWEVFLSEAQERMTLAVPQEKIEPFLELAARRDVEATELGEFSDSGWLHVTYGDETVAYLDLEFLHEGAPDLDLVARWSPPRFSEPDQRPTDYLHSLLDLLGRPNLTSNEAKARHYDHEVKGLTVIKPWIGVEGDVPAEATVFLARHGSLRGFVLSEGVNPFISDLDTYAMAATAVDEAVRRQICAGADLDRIAALDNFCWPDPVQSDNTPDGEYKLAQLVRACKALFDVCRVYKVPLISGKDSMKNESTMGGTKICVPPTLLVSAIGQIDDVRNSVTLDFKQPGDVIFLLGETGEHTGGSEYFRYLGEHHAAQHELGSPAAFVGNKAPFLEPRVSLPLYKQLHESIAAGLIRSAATPTKGGLAISLAKCSIAGGLGAEIELGSIAETNDLDPDVVLFAESNGRLVVTVAAEDVARFRSDFETMQIHEIGEVTPDPALIVKLNDQVLLEVQISELRHSFKKGLENV